MTIRFTMLDALNEDERDALQELMNLATGRAGDALARVLKVFVHLSVPVVRLVPAHEVNATLNDIIPIRNEFFAARQAFYHGLDGEAIIVFDQFACDNLWDLMGYEQSPRSITERIEMVTNVSNILVGALTTSIGEQLQTTVQFTAPSFLAHGNGLKALIGTSSVNWAFSLLVKIAFTVENREFSSYVALLFTEDSVNKLRRHAQGMLGD